MEIKQIVFLLVLLLVLDASWIYFIFSKPFLGMAENVQKEPIEFRIPGAIIAYIALFILALVFLPKTTLLEAFLLGFCVYAVYDATNYAIFNAWDPILATMDALWGGALFALLHLAIIR